MHECDTVILNCSLEKIEPEKRMLRKCNSPPAFVLQLSFWQPRAEPGFSLPNDWLGQVYAMSASGPVLEPERWAVATIVELQ